MDLFTQKELTQLLKEKNWENPTVRNIYYLIAVTGITFDDALGLTWKDVDFGGNFISLKDERKKMRLIPLNSVAVKLLKTLPGGAADPGQKVFDVLDYTGDEFYSALMDSGIPTEGRKLYPESVRASFIQILRDQGNSQEAIARVYGEF
ncbi:MAG: tyrosine-type recombinase/integrase [Spirochaetales bacterium]|nr:tyrosine-type recombinase/integrase [Spirochaetales bacterium]